MYYCEFCGKEMKKVSERYFRSTGKVKSEFYTCPEWKTYSLHDLHVEKSLYSGEAYRTL